MINLGKLRQLAENQKKANVNPAPPAPSKSKKHTGFKISVVDENGVKNRDFTDISQIKFESVKHKDPP